MSDPHSPRPQSKSVTREEIRATLPHAINFLFLPPRVVTDPVWDGVAVDIFDALPAAEPAASAEADAARERLTYMAADWDDTTIVRVTAGDIRAAIRSAGTPPASHETVQEALIQAWNDGHRAGIGCGHDLAICRHDEKSVAAEVDDLESWSSEVQAALRATPPEPVGGRTEFAWLIERGQPEKQVPTVWWADRKRWGLTYMDEWTEDAYKAFRFDSREAAEAAIAAKFTPPPSRGGPSARAVEHGFLGRPEPVGGREPVRESVVAAAVEWVEAHDALTLGNPTGPPDSDLLERYSEACNDLLAVVSQNRAALQATPPTGVSDGVALDVERLVDALLLVHSWDNYTAIAEARDIAREYQRLAREQADSEPQGGDA